MSTELAGEVGYDKSREDEVSLVTLARHGDGSALDTLYRQHRDRIYSLCLSLCNDRDLAQDLMQETFVRAYRALPSFAGRSSFITWLYRIAVNLSREVARRQKLAATPSQPQVEEDRETIDRVRATLGCLREHHRMVLALRYTQGLSYQEIAECLGWSLARVRITIHRAKKEFREVYQKPEEG